MTQRYRNVFLIDALGMGGAENLMVSFLNHFDRTHFETRVCVLGVRQGNPIAGQIEELGYPVDMVPISRLRDATAMPRLLHYLREQEVDILHTQLEHANTLGNLVAALQGIPSVCTLHTFDDPPRGTSKYWRYQLMWWSLRANCDRVLAVSEGTRQHHIRVGGLPPDKIVTMYNGIDLTRFARTPADRSRMRSALGIPPDATVLMTVAVLRQPKGIQYMLDALPAVLESAPDVYYLLVGGGPYEAELKALAAERGVTDRVVFTGMRQDVPDLLAAGDVFVFPTLGDALPTVLAEAMASRLPIVACEIGGVPEMVEDGVNGLLVPSADAARLAEACIRLAGDPARREEMGRAGYAIAQQRFEVHAQVDNLVNLYFELLNQAHQ
jgi:glycosyltransferase involved in cell wall biosynthesis